MNSALNIVTAIDVGSAKTCVMVTEVTDSGLRYLAHAVCESRGSRKGLIVDLDKAVASVQKAVEKAESLAAVPVERSVVGVAGAHVRGVNSQGGTSLGSRAREISREDIRQAVERARAITMPEDRQVMHLLPQEFILDGTPGVREPAGMIAARLEARVHLVTAASSATQNVVTTLNRAGIEVDDTIFEGLASGDAVVRPEERELGACIADIGAGSTELIVYHDSTVIHTGVIPVGGDHFTNDVAVGLRTPLADAEKIKKTFGCAVVTRIPETNEIEVPSVGDRPSRLLSQRTLGEVLEPRARELFQLMRDHLRQAGVLDLCTAGIVLTGGGAKLSFLTEVAESVLRKQIRIGAPVAIAKMPAELVEPEFATVIGSVLCAFRSRTAMGHEQPKFTSRLRSMLARLGA